MAKTEKRRAKAGFFTKLLLLVLLAALGWRLLQLHDRVAEARAQAETLSGQVAQRQQENDRLQEKIDQGGSQEQKEEIARDELGLVSPNEKIFYDVSN